MKERTGIRVGVEGREQIFGLKATHARHSDTMRKALMNQVNSEAPDTISHLGSDTSLVLVTKMDPATSWAMAPVNVTNMRMPKTGTRRENEMVSVAIDR